MKLPSILIALVGAAYASTALAADPTLMGRTGRRFWEFAAPVPPSRMFTISWVRLGR